MATMTKAEIAARALEALGVKAASQSTNALDGARAEEAVDAVHARLRKEGLAPFATSAVPEWAQSQLINIVAMDLVPAFGVGGLRLQLVASAAQQGRADLVSQCAAMVPNIAAKSEFF